MAILQEIESELISINEAKFQQLCDDYLFWSEDNYPDITRTGTQKGKQKTKKGTPDTYWKLPSGKYVFAEHTTQNRQDSKAAFLKKLKADLTKCLDSAVTGIEPGQIQKIILCFNSAITAKETEALHKIVRKYHIELVFKSIDKITLDLFGRYQHLAAKHLSLQIDSGQVLRPRLFLEEYTLHNGGLSAPLDNEMYYREDELRRIAAGLIANNIVVLSGAPGVGKSKLALAAMNEWLEINKGYEGYCISNKNTPIFEDLKSHIKEDRDYVLFVDDANRQSSNLVSVLSLLQIRRSGDLKVIVTVRDYALEYVKGKCFDYRYAIILIQGMPDNQLETILKSPDFNITNQLFLKRILDIAKGNPRVAVMAAKLAIRQQNIEALHDLDDFYETYFQSFIRDEDLFTNIPLQKTLGIVSFFYWVDRSNKDLYYKILADFGLTHQEFSQHATLLEKLELLETTPDNAIVKISDQVLSTFFFYKTFIKDRILDFKILTFNYFESLPNRFSDTVIPANNDFGYDKVLNRINAVLSAYYNSLAGDENRAYNFLKIFWFYKPEETLAFVYNHISALPIAPNPEFIIDRKNNNINWEIDKYLKLLFNFFYHPTDHAATAIEIAFQYVERMPSLYGDLYKEISETFKFSREDERMNFARQAKFIAFLLGKANQKSMVHLKMFLHLFPSLMKTVFDIHGGSRRKMEISFYYYPLPANHSVIKSLRKKLWNHLAKIYLVDVAAADEAMYEYLKPEMDKVVDVLRFDQPFLVSVINRYFDPKKFVHCYFVQRFIYSYAKMGISDVALPDLKQRYYSTEYKWYKLLDMDRLRNKEQHEYENLDIDKFERLKEIELRYKPVFTNITGFRVFYDAFVTIVTCTHIQAWNFDTSLDIIIDEIYLRNKRLGLACLKEIQDKNNIAGYVPFRIIQSANQAGEKQVAALYKIISAGILYNSDDAWKLRFISLIKPEFVRREHYDLLLKTYKELTQYCYFEFKPLDKFLAFDSNVFVKVLQIFCEKVESKIHSGLEYNFFQNYLHHFATDLSLPKKAYLYCDGQKITFDHDCRDFLAILQLDRRFLLEYLAFISGDTLPPSVREYKNLSIIWQLTDAEKLVSRAMDFFAKKDFYFISEHIANVFFTQPKGGDKDRHLRFLKEFLKKSIKSIVKVNLILNVFRHSFKEAYTTIIAEYLKLNNDFEDFKQLKLLDSFFISNGHVIWADVRAASLEEILSSVSALPQQYKYLQHKVYLKRLIEAERNSAEWERKRQFIEEGWQ